MISFIIHGGYGKTATTFLQSNIFSYLDDVLYLGKLINGKVFPDDLQNLYHSIFPSFVDMDNNEVRARNSSLLIPLFGDILLREIKQSEKNIVLLSNESLIDYGNYNAELNQFLLFKLFRYLQKKCDEEIEFKVMMTIRNQKELLKSFYAYDYIHLKNRFNSFNKFIRYGLNNKHKNIFGGYYYDIVLEDMQNIYGVNNVKFFVYEKMKENTEEYLESILNFIGSKQSIKSLNYKDQVNVNSKEGVHYIRDVKYGFIASLLMRLWKTGLRNKSKLEFLKNIKLFQYLKNTIQLYMNNNMKSVRRGELSDFPEELSNEIDDMYRNSNSRLSKMLDLDLEKYGYICNKHG